MQFKDICTKKTIAVNQETGETKAIWLKCGTLRITDEGKMFIELNHQPSVDYYVFNRENKE